MVCTARYIPPTLSHGPELFKYPRQVFLFSVIIQLDYIFSTATSIDVERLFSRGHLLLSHVRSRLSAQSTRALLCLGMWSDCNLVMDDDVKWVSELQDVKGDREVALEDGWDRIIVN